MVGGGTAFLWGGLVRVGLLHHVTWSINPICHMAGRRRSAPATARPCGGSPCLVRRESWHNLHHADPTCARHGERGQIDMSARLIWVFERFGWHAVRWPTPQRPERLARRSTA